MSYTPPEQRLEGPIAALVHDIDVFIRAAEHRIEDPSEWQEEHLLEMEAMNVKLKRLKIKLRKLSESTR